MFFSVEEGFTHIHLIGFFISWWVVLEIHDSGVLCTGIIPWEMIVGLKPQIMSVTRRDLRSRHLEVKVYKTFGPLIHMIDSEKHLRRLRPLIRTITFQFCLRAPYSISTGLSHGPLAKVVPSS